MEAFGGLSNAKVEVGGCMSVRARGLGERES